MLEGLERSLQEACRGRAKEKDWRGRRQVRGRAERERHEEKSNSNAIPAGDGH